MKSMTRQKQKTQFKKITTTLTTQRKEWKVAEKEYKAKITEAEIAKTNHDKEITKKDKRIASLEKEKLTPEERKKLSEAEDQNAIINKLTNDFADLKENFSNKEKEAESEKQARLQADLDLKRQAQKTKISNELNSHKILDSKNKQSLYTIMGEGLAKLNTNEDGIHEEKYYVINKGKEEPSTLEDMIAKFASENEHLVASSGNTGTGQPHTRGNNNSNAPKTLADHKAAASAMLTG